MRILNEVFVMNKLENISLILIKLLVIIAVYVELASCICHEQETRDCESICRKDLNGQCTIRGAVILPKSSMYEGSLDRVCKNK
jgi:hypothetical protein